MTSDGCFSKQRMKLNMKPSPISKIFFLLMERSKLLTIILLLSILVPLILTCLISPSLKRKFFLLLNICIPRKHQALTVCMQSPLKNFGILLDMISLSFPYKFLMKDWIFGYQSYPYFSYPKNLQS